MNSHTLQHDQPSHDGHVSFGDNRPQEEIAGTGLAHTAPDEFYGARLNDFTSDILGDLADRWIRLFEPQPDYHGENPIWWPENITMMKPHRMLKHDRVMLLQQLLCGKLVEYSKDALEAETQNIPRLQNSPPYRGNLTKILDFFHNRRTHLKRITDETLQACRFVPVTSVRQIVDVKPGLPAPLADLNYDFFVEWLQYSPRGEPLHNSVTTRCGFRGKLLVPLMEPTPIQLQDPRVGRHIQQDARIGCLKIVVAYSRSPLKASVHGLSYLAFSIRTAIPQPIGPIRTLEAQGWEHAPKIIAESEAQYLAMATLMPRQLAMASGASAHVDGESKVETQTLHFPYDMPSNCAPSTSTP